jgi:Holliday junction resolvase RusA-like endonuclease
MTDVTPLDLGHVPANRVLLARAYVPGVPKTKGHLTPKSTPRKGQRMHFEEGPGSKRWRMFIVERVRAERQARGIAGPPWTGPVEVTATFYQDVADVTVKSAGSGDADTLMRNVLDALSWNKDPDLGAGVYLDDMQVVVERGRKRRSAPGQPGMVLTVYGIIGDDW